MPRKDPVTGCQVMTFGEFWKVEGEREGRDPGELMDEFFREMEEDDARVASEMKDPGYALKAIKNFLAIPCDIINENERRQFNWDTKCEYGFDADDIVECTEVIDTSYHGSFSGAVSTITALLKLKDNSTRVVKLTVGDSFGTRIDPPDHEEEMVVLAVNNTSVVGKFDTNCTFGKLDVPMCDICKKFGGGALHGMKNAAAYLLPARYKGKTIMWVYGCPVYDPEWWYEGTSELGPFFELKQQESKLPMCMDSLNANRN